MVWDEGRNAPVIATATGLSISLWVYTKHGVNSSQNAPSSLVLHSLTDEESRHIF